MKILRYLRVAIESIIANKLRSVLTALGIIIGVAAVLTTMGIGTGAAASITEDIESTGTNLLTVSAGGGNSSGSTLTMSDALALADRSLHPDLEMVVPAYSGNAMLTFNDIDSQNEVLGTLPNYAIVRSVDLEVGRFFTQQEVDNQSRVTVMGFTVAEDLYGSPQAALGQTVRINNDDFSIIGVLEESGGGGPFAGNDSQSFIPLTIAQGRIFQASRYRGDYTITNISIRAADGERLDEAELQIEQTLRLRHGLGVDDDNDFTVFNQASLLDVAMTISRTLSVFLGSIGAVSLLVGGIGIMNIMLVSVTERTREIGLRKALGAHDNDILLQFIIEALVLCLLGGIIGIAFSYGVGFLVNQIPNFPFPVIISPGALLLALGVSTGSGVVFGFYPALRATRLDPIDALRYE
ncbi:MAG: ABC transporter permease [Chloroflexota bacterium]